MKQLWLRDLPSLNAAVAFAADDQERAPAPQTRPRPSWSDYLRKIASFMIEVGNADTDDEVPSPTIVRTLCTMFGLRTFIIVDKNSFISTGIKFQKSVPSTLYNIFLTAAIAGVWIPNMYGRVPHRGESLMIIKLSSLFVNLSMIAGLVSLITSRINSWSTQEMIRMCMVFDYTLLEDPSFHYKKSSKRFILAIAPMLVFMFIAGCLSLWDFLLHCRSPALSLNITFHVVLFIVLTMTIDCMYWVCELQKRLKSINERFRQFDMPREGSEMSLVVSDHSSDSCVNEEVPEHMPESSHYPCGTYIFPGENNTESTIFQLRELYKILFNLISLINVCFEASIFFFYLFLWAMIVHLGYNTVIFIFYPYFENVTSGVYLSALLTWTFLFSGQAIFIMWTSKSIAYGARETRDIIKDKLEKPQLGEVIVHQLKLFLEQVSDKELSFSAGGFFALLEPLLCSVWVSMVAFVPLLLQVLFQPSSGKLRIPTK